MSATPSRRIEAAACRDAQDAKACELGHALTWRLAPNSTRRGHCYSWEGECGDCGAEVLAGAWGSSCRDVRDARHDRCGGPGTSVLTEIEAGRLGELVAGAVSRFGESLR